MKICPGSIRQFNWQHNRIVLDMKFISFSHHYDVEIVVERLNLSLPDDPHLVAIYRRRWIVS